MSPPVAALFAARHRKKVAAAARYALKLLAFAAILLAVTVGPMRLGWWETPIPAGIGAAIATVVVFSAMVMFPLELVAYVSVCFDRPGLTARGPGLFAGRRLYRRSGRLDALATEGGLPLLSGFESADVLDTGARPVFFDPAAAVPTLDYLLTRLDGASREHADLSRLGELLKGARAEGARFYFLVHTLGGVTNAEIEARRRGED